MKCGYIQNVCLMTKTGYNTGAIVFALRNDPQALDGIPRCMFTDPPGKIFKLVNMTFLKT